MKRIFPITVLFLFPIIIYSCNNNGDADYLYEDYFEVHVLIPNNDVKESIGKNVLSFISSRLNYDIDNMCAQVECNAIWKVSNIDDPSSIKVIEIDTSLFYLTINEDSDTETLVTWDNVSAMPLLQTIKTILDTCTYSLYCENHNDVSPNFLLSSYIDSIAETEIYFKICLKNNTD